MSEFKKWISIGLGTALLSASLSACHDASEQMSHGQTASISIAGKDHSKMSDSASTMDHSMDSLPIEHRLAFMTGHVKAGLALYRAGVPKQAAPHLLHPVSETHQSERKGLDALGFEASLFEVVSEALEQGRPASEIEPQLIAAEDNLNVVAKKAGGDPVSIINFLMDTIDEEYAIAITDGVVSDAGEYQDAFGFAYVAKNQALRLGPTYRDAVLTEIDSLISFWPDAPIAPELPTPVSQITAQTAAIKQAVKMQ